MNSQGWETRVDPGLCPRPKELRSGGAVRGLSEMAQRPKWATGGRGRHSAQRWVQPGHTRAFFLTAGLGPSFLGQGPSRRGHHGAWTVTRTPDSSLCLHEPCTTWHSTLTGVSSCLPDAPPLGASPCPAPRPAPCSCTVGAPRPSASQRSPLSPLQEEGHWQSLRPAEGVSPGFTGGVSVSTGDHAAGADAAPPPS